MIFVVDCLGCLVCALFVFGGWVVSVALVGLRVGVFLWCFVVVCGCDALRVGCVCCLLCGLGCVYRRLFVVCRFAIVINSVGLVALCVLLYCWSGCSANFGWVVCCDCFC